MAFDGIVVSNIVSELNHTIKNGRLFKIAQTEKDELILTIKNERKQYRLLISANPSLPLMYLTEERKQSPITAPNFCMLLRKHIQNGRIVEISQPGLERIIDLKIEHLNELGDLCTKTLVCELMGKHSNIIFCDDQKQIIDSIRHIPANVSSVREVLPGRPYFIPNTMDKADPLTCTEPEFATRVFTKNIPLSKAIYTSFTGISPVAARSLCTEAGFSDDVPADSLAEYEKIHICHFFQEMISAMKAEEYQPCMYVKDGVPMEYHAFPLHGYEDCSIETFTSISTLLQTYYSEKEVVTRIRQKSSDLRRIVSTALSRDRKKYALQQKQLADTNKKDKYKLYGELLTTYGYSLPPQADRLDTTDYYTGKPVSIPLDPTISPIDNAKKYFDRYSKLKRTADALADIIKQTEDSITHLESVAASLEIATDEDSLKEIKEELIQYGYIHRSGKSRKKERIVSKPMHFISSDGYDMYVGKNNFQNENLTFHVATGNDWWFHAKGTPGSHVIVKANNEELPDSTFEEAAALAAHFSKASSQEKVEVDYIQKKQIKKVAGAKPGFVIYHTNYSMTISPDIRQIKEVK